MRRQEEKNKEGCATRQEYTSEICILVFVLCPRVLFGSSEERFSDRPAQCSERDYLWGLDRRWAGYWNTQRAFMGGRTSVSHWDSMGIDYDVLLFSSVSFS